MSGLYQIFLIVFLVLTFFAGFVVNVSRFDVKIATNNSTNQRLNQYAQLLDERTTRMLEVKGQVVFDTSGFYLSQNKFSKRKQMRLGAGQSFFYFEKDTSVQFTVSRIDEDGVVLSYEAHWADRSTGQEIVSADQGTFKLGWKF